MTIEVAGPTIIKGAPPFHCCDRMNELNDKKSSRSAEAGAPQITEEDHHAEPKLHLLLGGPEAF